MKRANDKDDDDDDAAEKYVNLGDFKEHSEKKKESNSSYTVDDLENFKASAMHIQQVVTQT